MSEMTDWALLPITDDQDVDDLRARLSDGGFDARLAIAVPASELVAAQEFLSGGSDDADPTHELDLETILVVQGTTAEMETAAIRSLLESNGISVVVEEAVGFPNLPIEINVARKHATLAKQLIADAQQSGPGALDAEPEAQ